jgi:UDP-sulfoquinovose synthase
MTITEKDKNWVLVLGGDGFVGWPTALKLSKAGFDVVIVDNMARRIADVELECESLTPIQPMSKRIKAWEEITGKKIKYENFDVSDNYHRLLTLLYIFKPVAIVHLAEQRAAPYSMKSSYHKRYTVNNNLNATNNILCAIVESEVDSHLVHLGTTGYYGYSDVGMTIPEGYLPVKVDVDGQEKKIEIMYPPNPGSIYHTTKCQDAIFFLYFNKNDKVRITDLHQGVVWGTQTEETKLDERLINRFDYDGDYGTVLNRFLMQSQVDHPLTVYGTGGQTRAFIHIQNSVECIELAVLNSPDKGDRVRIFNQTTECLNVKELAEKVALMTKAQLRFYKNPRNEDAENNLKFINDGLINLGLNPITLDDGLMYEVMEIAKKYKERCILDKIICTSVWSKDKKVDHEGSGFIWGGDNNNKQ